MLADRRSTRCLGAVVACALAGFATPASVLAAEPGESPAAPVPAPELPPNEGPQDRESLWPPCSGIEPGASEADRRAAADREILDAEQAFRNGDTTVALQHVDFAECHHPDPDYAFMRAVIHAASGDCDAARDWADTYFKGDPNPSDANALRHKLRSCAPPVNALPVLPASPPRVAPPIASAPPPPQDRHRAWRLDPLGGALLGVGLVSTATGTGLLVAGSMAQRDTADSYAEFEHTRQRARRFRIAGGAVLGVGLGLTVGAIVRYVLVARRSRRSGRPDRSVAATHVLSSVVRF